MASSLFSGLCFGDISPSQESSSSMLAATLPDIPNGTVTPGCGDRDVTPLVLHHNTSHSPSRANYFGGFDPSGYDLDGDILPTDPEDDREYPPPDTASLTQNACVSAIASTGAELIELSQSAYSHPYNPAFDAEPPAVLSAGDISNFNILDSDVNNEQIQPDAYPDILSAPLQADSLQIELHCIPDQELSAEITRNASQNSHYDFHCADEPELAVAHADSDLFTSSQILPERTDCDADLIQFSPSEEALYSSPPCSSPSKIFSSSSPLSSQTSASTEPSPDESEVSKQTLETGHDHDDQSQLISSNSGEQVWNEDTRNNHDVDALPPSSSPFPLVSSPFRSSSPLQTVQEDTKQNPEADDFLQDDEFFHTPAESESKDIPASRDTSTSHMIAEVTQQSGAAPEFPMQEPRSLDDIASAFRLPEAPPHVKRQATLAPGPKRPTVMSHLRQHKKLSTPFRSPLIKKENDQHISPLPAVTKPPVPAAKTIMRSEVKSIEVKHTVLNDPKKKHRTVRAAAQFKSPLSAAASSNVMPSVRMTPTIQSLERRVQVLRRAVKVKKDGEEELLESLAKRWTEAAREVAWELWDLVKDNGANEGGSWGRDPKHKRGFEDSWGWEEKGDQKRLKTENSWGWDEPEREKGEEDEDQMQGVEPHGENDDARDDEEDKPENTMGLMLRQFGIAPDTLGWNEEDGMFAESLLR